MVKKTFDSAVVASAYTGQILIPEEHPLYNEVHTFIKSLEDSGLVTHEDLLSPEYRRQKRQGMEALMPNVCFSRFEAALQAYHDKQPPEATREDRWPHIEMLADKIIGDQTLDL